MPAVARAGRSEVKATPDPVSGTITYAPAAAGVVEVAHPTLTVGGAAVLASASCVFTSTDSSTGTTTSLPAVVLNAGATKLTVGSTGVLVDADSAQGSGGTVSVSIAAPGPLSTA